MASATRKHKPRLLLIEEAIPVLRDALYIYTKLMWEQRAAVRQNGQGTNESNRKIKMARVMLRQLREIEEEFGW